MRVPPAVLAAALLVAAVPAAAAGSAGSPPMEAAICLPFVCELIELIVWAADAPGHAWVLLCEAVQGSAADCGDVEAAVCRTIGMWCPA